MWPSPAGRPGSGSRGPRARPQRCPGSSPLSRSGAASKGRRGDADASGGSSIVGQEGSHLPPHGPRWVRLNQHQIGIQEAAIFLSDEEPPLEAETVKGLAFFGSMSDEAEKASKGNFRQTSPVN